MKNLSVSWESIPAEIQREIGAYLDTKSLCFFAATNKRSLKNVLPLLLLRPPWWAITLGFSYSVYGTTLFYHSYQQLYACGFNRYGQLGLGHHQDCNTFTPVTSLKGQIQQVRTGPGGYHTFVLTDQGLFVCGHNEHGQLGLGSTRHPYNYNTFMPITSLQGRIRQVITSLIFGTLVLTDQGLFACGKNGFGELGLGHNEPCNTFIPIPSFKDQSIRQIIAGAYHTFVLTDQGLFACGRNNYGQLGLGHKDNCNTFTLITSLRGQVQQVIVGDCSTFVLTDQGLFVCGYNEFGQLGLGHHQECITFMPVTALKSKVQQIATSSHHTLVLTDQGLFACGYNGHGQLGVRDKQDRATLTPVMSFQGRILQMIANFHQTVVLTDQGLFACGYNGHGQLGVGDKQDRATLTLVTSFQGQILQVFAGKSHTVVLTDQGLFGCGYHECDPQGRLELSSESHETFTLVKTLPKEAYSLHQYINQLKTIVNKPAPVDEERTSTFLLPQCSFL